VIEYVYQPFKKAFLVFSFKELEIALVAVRKL